MGLKNAAVFKAICQKCDTEYFKLYETPEMMLGPLTPQILGQIATKNLLREISKARYGFGVGSALGDQQTFDMAAKLSVRSIDLKEDEKAFKIAARVGKTGKPSSAYHIMFHKVLPYMAPFAFQQMITPISDFRGAVINNIYNPSPNCRMEPMHLCVLPVQGQTVVLAFRSEKAKRYRELERQLRTLGDAGVLQTFVKLIFAYSEDVFISKRISGEVLEDANLRALARMDSAYGVVPNRAGNCRIPVIKTAQSEYALDNLPEPPRLLSPEFAL